MNLADLQHLNADGVSLDTAFEPSLPTQAVHADGEAQSVVQALADPAWLVDALSLRVVVVNQAASRLLNQGSRELLGRDAQMMLDTVEDHAFWQGVRCGHIDPLHSELRLTLAASAGDGGRTVEKHFLRHITTVADPVAGACGYFLVVMQDCSAERAALLERDVALAELNAILEATADGILVTDLHGRVRAFNQQFASLWSLPASVLHAEDPSHVHEWMRQQVVDAAGYTRRLADIVDGTAAAASESDRLTLLSGVVLERHVRPQLSRGQAVGRVFSFRCAAAASTRGSSSATRRELATEPCDQLTGLPDRPQLLRQLDDALQHTRRGAGGLAVISVELDLSGLDPQCVDTDRLLGEAAHALRACVRQPDKLARVAASRFMLVVHHVGEVGAETLARRIISTLSHRLPLATREHDSVEIMGSDAASALPVSVGVATYPEAGTTAFELLAHADAALGWAQQGQPGRHRVYRASEDRDRRRDARLEAALARTLDRAPQDGRLRLHFQPQVDMASGAVQSVEALMRWRDVEFGEIAPGRFLPVAQQCGVLMQLQSWALREALAQAASWQAAGMAWPVSLNVCADELLQPGFARRVSAALRAAGLPASRLVLEFREDALLADAQTASATLAALSQCGVGLTLDDFGLGFSAIGHLRELPIQSVKLDRRLVRDLPHHPVHAQSVKALVALLEALHVAVIAKGVENQAQARFLMEAGCSKGQGFLYGAAQPAGRLGTAAAAA